VGDAVQCVAQYGGVLLTAYAVIRGWRLAKRLIWGAL
jgi:hypothetical protein